MLKSKHESFNPQVKHKRRGHQVEIHTKFPFQMLVTATIQFVNHFDLKKILKKNQ